MEHGEVCQWRGLGGESPLGPFAAWSHVWKEKLFSCVWAGSSEVSGFSPPLVKRYFNMLRDRKRRWKSILIETHSLCVNTYSWFFSRWWCSLTLAGLWVHFQTWLIICNPQVELSDAGLCGFIMSLYRSKSGVWNFLSTAVTWLNFINVQVVSWRGQRHHVKNKNTFLTYISRDRTETVSGNSHTYSSSTNITFRK